MTRLADNVRAEHKRRTIHKQVIVDWAKRVDGISTKQVNLFTWKAPARAWLIFQPINQRLGRASFYAVDWRKCANSKD